MNLSATSISGNFDKKISSSEKFILETQDLKSLKISGSFVGSGSAQVWLVTDTDQYLAIDTRLLSTKFENICAETCDLSSVNSNYLSVYIEDGVLSLNEYKIKASSNPSGLASCPGCKKVKNNNLPDHYILLLTLLLAIGIFGSHSLHHCCKNSLSKKVLIGLFIGGFIMIMAVFGISLTAPAGAAFIAKRAASVFAAIALMTIFVIAGFELNQIGKKSGPINPNVWAELEEAEEEWQGK